MYSLLSLVRKYKSVAFFILTFLGSYLILFGLYTVYLRYGGSDTYYPDIVTHLVANQSELLIDSLGYSSSIAPSKTDLAMNLTINGQWLARIVEGCNAVSIMLLFIAFMISFWNGTRSTLLYIISGLVLIYTVNIIRIAVLSIGIYEYPAYTELLHGTVFPAVIYGLVLLLWLVWMFIVSKKQIH